MRSGTYDKLRRNLQFFVNRAPDLQMRPYTVMSLYKTLPGCPRIIINTTQEFA